MGRGFLGSRTVRCGYICLKEEDALAMNSSLVDLLSSFLGFRNEISGDDTESKEALVLRLSHIYPPSASSDSE